MKDIHTDKEYKIKTCCKKPKIKRYIKQKKRKRFNRHFKRVLTIKENNIDEEVNVNIDIEQTNFTNYIKKQQLLRHRKKMFKKRKQHINSEIDTKYCLENTQNGKINDQYNYDDESNNLVASGCYDNYYADNWSCLTHKNIIITFGGYNDYIPCKLFYDIYYYENTPILVYKNFKPIDIMKHDCNFWITEKCMLCLIQNTENISLFNQLFELISMLRYIPFKQFPNNCSKYVKIMSKNDYFDYLIKSILKTFIQRHVNYENINQYYGLINMINTLLEKPFDHFASLEAICSFFRIYLKNKNFRELCTNIVLMLMNMNCLTKLLTNH